MGLWRFFKRRPAVGSAAPAPHGIEPEPLPPEQLTELQGAWAELAEAAEGSGVTGLHACSRNGRRWEEDPAAVRGLAATLREIRAENANS